jgi:hypothetical protein
MTQLDQAESHQSAQLHTEARPATPLWHYPVLLIVGGIFGAALFGWMA